MRSVTGELDTCFSDIWDYLDMGFMGVITAQKGPWSLSLDVVHMDLEDDVAASSSGGLGIVTVEGNLKVETSLAMASKDYTAKLVCRHMYWDYEEDGYVWDMTASGPYFGLGIRT